MLKRIMSIVLTLVMVLGMSISALASNEITIDSKKLQKISDLYQIPMSILESLNKDSINQLSKDIDTKKLISVSDKYIKFVEQDDGNVVAVEGSLFEYLNEQSMPTIMVSADDSSSGWMKVRSTINVIDSTYAEVAGAFTWLTRPSLRLKDVVGLALAQGTIVGGTGYGFYNYSTALGSTNTYYSASSFAYEGHGLTRTQILAKPNSYPVLSDYIFIRANIYKEGSSEGLNASYGHQKLGITFGNNFTITRTGILSIVGFTIGTYYNQCKGYVSTGW